MVKDNLTLLKERLSAIEGEGNETVDLSGILALIDALEYDIERNEAEISTLKNEINSLEGDVESLMDKDPATEDWKDDVKQLKALVILLGAVLFISILIGIVLFVILLGIVFKRKRTSLEE